MGNLDSFDARRVARLENPVRPYAWGSSTVIAALQGRPSPAPGPEAELWIGAHPKAPSRVLWDGGEAPLDALIEARPREILGERVIARFGPRLPFLLKVLAVERPLSLQAHPDAEQAREGFAREERQGIPRSARERCYPDPSHKPEVLCALGEFHALAGFRPVPEIRERLAALGVEALAEVPHALDAVGEEQALRGSLHRWLRMPEAHRADVLHRVAAAAERLAPEDAVFDWLGRLHAQHPGDPGVLAPVFLQLLALSAGEAIFLPAREPHCFLQGVAVEIMTSSDNVLRGGLTGKHVALPELERILRFATGGVSVVKPESRPGGVEAYPAPVADFELCRLDIAGGATTGIDTDAGAEVLLCTAGAVAVRTVTSAGSLELSAGEGCLVPAAAEGYTVSGQGTLYRAAVPGGATGAKAHPQMRR